VVTDPPSFSSRQQVLSDLRERGFRFQEKRGQNFLFDPNLLRALVRDAGVEAGDHVLEIGPGAGTLTAMLLELGCRVTAVEIDPILCQYLRESFPEDRFRLIEGDALETKNRLSSRLISTLDEDSAAGSGFHLVANLPYSIASPLISLLVAARSDLKSIGVLVQREMAQRWVAEVATRQYGTTSVLLQWSGKGRICRSVPSSAFIPPPSVESSFYHWQRDPRSELPPEGWMSLVRWCFQFRRKTLGKILQERLSREDPWWGDHGVETSARPDQLSPEQWLSLYQRCGDDPLKR